jgi:hypothetical protein
VSRYEFHPLANVLPLIEGAQFDDLVADIKASGLHDPIVIHNDLILDGRNRYRACLAAGVDPVFVPYRGDDPVAFVISVNLRRRHLDESQRAMVAARLATLRLGDNQHSGVCQLAEAPRSSMSASGASRAPVRCSSAASPSSNLRSNAGVSQCRPPPMSRPCRWRSRQKW